MENFLIGYFDEEENRKYINVKAENDEKAWDHFEEVKPYCSVFLIVDSSLEVVHAD